MTLWLRVYDSNGELLMGSAKTDDVLWKKSFALALVGGVWTVASVT